MIFIIFLVSPKKMHSADFGRFKAPTWAEKLLPKPSKSEAKKHKKKTQNEEPWKMEKMEKKEKMEIRSQKNKCESRTGMRWLSFNMTRYGLANGSRLQALPVIHAPRKARKSRPMWPKP